MLILHRKGCLLIEYKKGDRVHILSLPVGQYLYPPSGEIEMGYTEGMRKLASPTKVYTIQSRIGKGIYHLERTQYTWTKEFLQPAVSVLVNQELLYLLKEEI